MTTVPSPSPTELEDRHASPTLTPISSSSTDSLVMSDDSSIARGIGYRAEGGVQTLGKAIIRRIQAVDAAYRKAKLRIRRREKYDHTSPAGPDSKDLVSRMGDYLERSSSLRRRRARGYTDRDDEVSDTSSSSDEDGRWRKEQDFLHWIDSLRTTGPEELDEGPDEATSDKSSSSREEEHCRKERDFLAVDSQGPTWAGERSEGDDGARSAPLLLPQFIDTHQVANVAEPLGVGLYRRIESASTDSDWVEILDELKNQWNQAFIALIAICAMCITVLGFAPETIFSVDGTAKHAVLTGAVAAGMGVFPALWLIYWYGSADSATFQRKVGDAPDSCIYFCVHARLPFVFIAISCASVALMLLDVAWMTTRTTVIVFGTFTALMMGLRYVVSTTTTLALALRNASVTVLNAAAKITHVIREVARGWTFRREAPLENHDLDALGARAGDILPVPPGLQPTPSPPTSPLYSSQESTAEPVASS